MRGVDPDLINNTPLATEIGILGGNGNGFQLTKLSARSNRPYVLTPPDPVPANTDITEWKFDSTATSADPVDLRVQYDTNIILSAEAKAQYDANEITITPESTAWNPDQSDDAGAFYQPAFIFDASVAGSISASGSNLTTWSRVNGAGEVQAGGLTLAPASTNPIQTTPTYDSLNKLIDLPSVGDNNAGPLEFSSARSVKALLMICSLSSTFGASLLAPASGSQIGQFVAGGSAQIGDVFDGALSGPGESESAWNGEIKGTAGSEVVEFESPTSQDYFFKNNTSSPTQPAVDEVFMVLLRSAPSTFNWQYIGARWSGAEWQRTGPMKVHLVMGWSTVPSEDYFLQLQGWALWKASAQVWTPSLLLPDTGEGDLGLKHPYRDAPPGGSGTPTVTVSAPVLSITFRNAPTGAALNIWDDEDANASADHGTLLFTATPDGTDKVWNSGVTAGNRVIVQWVPASPYAFKEINFPYVIPNNSVEFDLTPLLIAEDGI